MRSHFETIGWSDQLQVPPEVERQVRNFLYLEAELLDRSMYAEWLTLLDANVRYHMAVNDVVMPEDRAARTQSGFGGSIFDDNMETLCIRVRKALSGKDVSERPSSMLQHMVSNIRLGRLDHGKSYRALSYFSITRVRGDDRVDQYTGEYEHVLAEADNEYGLAILSKKISLNQSLLLGGGIGFLL